MTGWSRIVLNGLNVSTADADDLTRVNRVRSVTCPLPSERQERGFASAVNIIVYILTAPWCRPSAILIAATITTSEAVHRLWLDGGRRPMAASTCVFSSSLSKELIPFIFYSIVRGTSWHKHWLIRTDHLYRDINCTSLRPLKSDL